MEFRTHRKLLGPFKLPQHFLFSELFSYFQKKKNKITSESLCKICNIDTQTGKIVCFQCAIVAAFRNVVLLRKVIKDSKIINDSLY